MGKDKKQTSTQRQSFGTNTDIDPSSQQFREFLRQQGRAGVGTANDPRQQFFTGPNAAQTGALDQLRGLPDVQAQNLGFTPGQMDPNRARDFFNPFQDRVIGSIQQAADRQRAIAGEQAGLASTQQGFGTGSRQAVAEQLANRSIGENELAQIARTSQQGFGQAQGLAANEFGLQQNLGFGAARANQEAALRAALANQGAGLQSANQQFNMGSILQQLQQQQAQEPLFRRQQALQFAQGALGPVGQQSSGFSRGRNEQVQEGNLFGNILGLAGAVGGALLPGVGGVPERPQAVAPTALAPPIVPQGGFI